MFKVISLKFIINHVELLHDEGRGYHPIIYAKISHNPNISSRYSECDVGKDIIINSCYYFFNSPKDYEFRTVSNHILTPKNDIIKTIY
jgi:hypothetical protein